MAAASWAILLDVTEPPRTMTVETERLNVRQAPSTDATILCAATLTMRSEHPELARPLKRCLGALHAVSWPWIPVLGSLEPPRRDGENAQKTGKNGGKMGEIRPKTCEGVGITCYCCCSGSRARLARATNQRRRRRPSAPAVRGRMDSASTVPRRNHRASPGQTDTRHRSREYFAHLESRV